MLPENLVQPLQAHLGKVRVLHRRDAVEGCGEVWLPHALARKYPRAAREWGWQFVFPSASRSVDPRSGAVRRHHLHPDPLSRIVKRAASAARIVKPVSCHALRHPSPRISSSGGTTSARCRSSLATRTSPPP
jgi:hypothetical protein